MIRISLLTLCMLLAWLPVAGVAGQPKDMRRVVAGYDVNRPDAYPGMGDFAWAGNIAEMPDGRLLLVHSWGYWHASFAQPRLIEPSLGKKWGIESWPKATPTGGRCMLTMSDNRGKSWAKPRSLMDLPMDDCPYGILRCKDGTLLCTVNVQNSWYGYDEAPAEVADVLEGLNTQQCAIRSTDEGNTWSEPIWLTSPGKFYERSHAQLIQLPDGGILWPTYATDGRNSKLFGAIHRSDDSGQTWRLISTVRRENKNVDEPAIARLLDGRLIMACRPDGGVFLSEDDGVTWTETGRIVNKGKFKAPRLFVLSDGTVVCVATHSNLRVFLSKDQGSTWTDSIPLDTSSYGYPGGIKLQDDSMIVSYVTNGRPPNRISVIRFQANAERDGIELLPLGEYTEDPDIDN